MKKEPRRINLDTWERPWHDTWYRCRSLLNDEFARRHDTALHFLIDRKMDDVLRHLFLTTTISIEHTCNRLA